MLWYWLWYCWAVAAVLTFPQPGALPGAGSPELRMPKLQNQQPGLTSAAGTHRLLLVQNKHTNTSLCQGGQIPPGPAPLKPSRRMMAATFHQLLPVNGKTIYPDARVFHGKTFNSMQATLSFWKINCLLCAEAACHIQRNLFHVLQGIMLLLWARARAGAVLTLHPAAPPAHSLPWRGPGFGPLSEPAECQLGENTHL